MCKIQESAQTGKLTFARREVRPAPVSHRPRYDYVLQA